MNYIKRLYSGRIGRKNYGLGLLFFIGSLILLIAIFASMFSSDSSSSFGVFLIIVLYAVFILHLFSLHVRRFHDLGNSGWRVLLFFIPLVNLIILISLLATKGKDEVNEYGEVPQKSIKFFDAIFNKNQQVSSITEKNKDMNNQYCVKCGAQIESDSKFCFKCGAKIALNE